ncbi:hypothetical protein ACHAW6_010730 [Cyclotella cf. meneghiniana]
MSSLMKMETVFETLHNAGFSELFLNHNGEADEDVNGVSDGVSDGVSNGASDGAPICDSDGASTRSSRPQRSEHARHPPSWLDPNPTKIVYTLLPIGEAILPLTSWAQPPAVFANSIKKPCLFHNKMKVSRAELADHSLLRGQWSTEVSAFVAGHCGSQLSLPWIDDEEYWNSANASQR